MRILTRKTILTMSSASPIEPWRSWKRIRTAHSSATCRTTPFIALKWITRIASLNTRKRPEPTIVTTALSWLPCWKDSTQASAELMAKLDDLGLAEKTVVIFFGDNGMFGDPETLKPLRGAKGHLYEAGIREPLIVRWPGKVKANSVCDVPVISNDFYPTLAATGWPNAGPA